MGITEAVGQFFRAAAEACGLVRQRGQQNNTPEMVTAKAAQNEVKKEDEINKAVATDDADAIRKLGAE